VQGNQVYGPYGKQRYKFGTLGTSKGFTGQYNDSLTGLDYYNARYYDPKVGVFLSADMVEGNGVGMNPYAYVGGNPETYSDPTGQAYILPEGSGGGGGTTPVNSLGAGSFITIPSLPPASWTTSVAVAQQLSVAAGGGSRQSNPFVMATWKNNPLDAQNRTLTSCGVPVSQATCGEFGVFFALYLSTGGQLAAPSNWCIECGQPGGGNEGNGSSGGSDVLASSTGEASTGATDYVPGLDAEGANPPPPDGEPPREVEGGPSDQPLLPPKSGKVTLYRAIMPAELNDLLHFGDYDLSPHGGGKYFALTEQGARDFALSSLNAGQKMTLTSIEVPYLMLGRGDPFFDAGGAGWSIHFADDVLPDLYEVSGLPNILDAPWISNIGE
jgi:RHS repeat-associated protein